MATIPSGEEIALCLGTTPVEDPTDLERSVENLAHTNIQIISELKIMLEEINTYRRRTNVVKTAGTTIGVSGAVALCAAPFTAGLSTMLGIGGVVASSTSIITSIGTNVAYKRKIKAFNTNIEKLEEEQKLAAQELTLKLNIIHSVVEAIMDQSGVDEQVALKTTLYHIGHKTINLVAIGCDRILKDTTLINQVISQVNRLRDVAVGLIVAKGLNPEDVYRELTSPVINAALRLGQTASKEFNEFQTLVRSAGNAMKGPAVSGITKRTILQGVGATFAAIFSIIDVALLIRDWRNVEPLTETINTTIKQLQNDIGKCADILRVIRSFEERVVNDNQNIQEEEELQMDMEQLTTTTDEEQNTTS